MATIRCEVCDDNKRAAAAPIAVRCERDNKFKGTVFEGIVTCLIDGHRWPIKMREGHVVFTETALPLSDAVELSANIPEGILEDVEEAKRAHFSQCYKASVVMCRRAMQLSLIEKGIADAPLSVMLQKAREGTPSLLTGSTYALAEGIKEYGDRGAHRVEAIGTEETRVVIFTTLRVLNELFE